MPPPSPGLGELNQPAKTSREVDLVGNLLKVGLGSAEAVSTREAMKQAVVNRRFRLEGQTAQPPRENHLHKATISKRRLTLK